MDTRQYNSKLQSLYLDQISASSEFVRNVLQSCSIETNFGKQTYFQIGLPLKSCRGSEICCS